VRVQTQIYGSVPEGFDLNTRVGWNTRLLHRSCRWLPKMHLPYGILQSKVCVCASARSSTLKRHNTCRLLVQRVLAEIHPIFTCTVTRREPKRFNCLIFDTLTTSVPNLHQYPLLLPLLLDTTYLFQESTAR
jgi:hypothetical protein